MLYQGSAGESSGSTGGQVDEFNRRYVEEVTTYLTLNCKLVTL